MIYLYYISWIAVKEYRDMEMNDFMEENWWK